METPFSGAMAAQKAGIKIILLLHGQKYPEEDYRAFLVRTQ